RRLRLRPARDRRPRAPVDAQRPSRDPGRQLRRAVARRELERPGAVHGHATQGRGSPDRADRARAGLDDDVVGASGEMRDTNPDRVFIFDTTLRDGEQSTGFHLVAKSTLRIDRTLARLGVVIVEWGVLISSPLG